MKRIISIALLAILSTHAFGAIPTELPKRMNKAELAVFREELKERYGKTEEKSKTGLDPALQHQIENTFYTGKPYLPTTGTYAFKYRDYNPNLARWTSEDPSGFPDGANNSYYAPTPTSEFDWMGLKGKRVLWVTINNMFENGDYGEKGEDSENWNYISYFHNQYSKLNSWMVERDRSSAGTASETKYLSDGDSFDRMVAGSNSELYSALGAYDKVYFLTHGRVFGNEYQFKAPDGSAQPMYFFNGYMGDPEKIIMMTCYNGWATPGSSGTGALGKIDYFYAMNEMFKKTERYLYE